MRLVAGSGGNNLYVRPGVGYLVRALTPPIHTARKRTALVSHEPRLSQHDTWHACAEPTFLRKGATISYSLLLFGGAVDLSNAVQERGINFGNLLPHRRRLSPE